MKFKNLIELMDFFKTEMDCIKYLYNRRIKNNIACHYCGCNDSYLPKNETRIRCRKCKSKYSVRIGTIFQDSNIPLRKWFIAMYIYLSHKKGISSCQLAKDISVSQPTAWFMLQRLRHISKEFYHNEFGGTNEIDETYIGGKAINKHTKQRIKLKEKDDKAVVLGIVNQETKQVKSFHIKNSQYPQIAEKIIDNIEIGSTIITDEANVYKALGKYYYKHNSINHSKGEYVKNESREAFIITTNAVEGMFGLLKRGIDGIFHWVSKKHLQKYLNEFNFRYNTKDLQDNERFVSFLNNVSGRLRYCELVG